jgi:plastocyanin
MPSRPLTALAAAAILVLAGCSSSGGSAATSACKETTDAGAVTVSVVDFAFQPTDVAAKVGQVIAFSNTGSSAHTATLDGGQCATPTIQVGKSDGLVFSAAGTYKFHCSIHSQMTGTIVIS